MRTTTYIPNICIIVDFDHQNYYSNTTALKKTSIRPFKGTYLPIFAYHSIFVYNVMQKALEHIVRRYNTTSCFSTRT